MAIDLCHLVTSENRFENYIRHSKHSISLETHQQISGLVNQYKQTLAELVKGYVSHYYEKWFEKNRMTLWRAWKKNNGGKNWYDFTHNYKKSVKDSVEKKYLDDLFYYFLVDHIDTTQIDLESCIDIELYAQEYTHEKLNTISKIKRELDGLMLSPFDKITCNDYLKKIIATDEFSEKSLVLGGQSSIGDLLSYINTQGGYGHMVNHSVQDLEPPGSVFKMFIAYEALNQLYNKGYTTLEQLENNMFQMVDSDRKSEGSHTVGRFMNGKTIPKIYHKGRLPSSQRSYIGEIDIYKAVKTSSNPYFALLTEHYFDNHGHDLYRVMSDFGFSDKTDVDLTNEALAPMPLDLLTNQTGCYNTAIGQHSLRFSPMQLVRSMGALMNGGKLLNPKLIQGYVNSNGSYFPQSTDCIRQLQIPDPVSHILRESMWCVVNNQDGAAHVSKMRHLNKDSFLYKNYDNWSSRMIGKTSTAQVYLQPGVTRDSTVKETNRISFMAGGYKDEYSADHPPDIIVYVVMNKGRFGREAAPLAAAVMEKWCSLE